MAEGREVRSDDAESAVDGRGEKEDDKQMMRVPAALKVGPSCLFRRRKRDGHQRKQHDISTPSGSRGEAR